ncbi:SRPBCC family protein [Tenacibaculum maritimum]|uniref:Cell division inhibitor n=1 Tax=Tenacibaculum maritimum NCIMB 2154 TaxID=1349785 RepID=A0A2H1E6S5_9FLAO|nr:SRPBCC family protein [Tenacibaculum maritimum]MCD9561958.1 SRPBCC family protein [Tenacibaculum maritimum]MCD9564928.1 SRPBCC family protein [Tenacibaculum maritimum]MCD9578901.1 SRPBCC family protein [Tenacibaculum maritimum]MCD9582565.1 SRPBCC family protein [Tenacibaculum maritimum]MCD9583962.1 SRPBCC family protein [Tenacibaculum maritimum]
MITFFKHSGIYTLEASQELNIAIEKAWDYFSSPENLASITPPKMGFQITAKVDKKAYQGQIITYKVSPVLGIKMNWVTEITVVKEQNFFVDEQRFGPYKMWHHEHWFEKLPDGKTLMKDKVSYKLPFGILGRLAHKIFVKSELKAIFEYRFKTLNALFNG